MLKKKFPQNKITQAPWRFPSQELVTPKCNTQPATHQNWPAAWLLHWPRCPPVCLPGHAPLSAQLASTARLERDVVGSEICKSTSTSSYKLRTQAQTNFILVHQVSL